MYEVSNDYMTAMHQKVQRHKIKGTIGSVPFSDDDILAGSLTISNQCSGNEEIAIGQVYVGEFKATFRGLEIARGAWQGKEIAVDFSLLTDSENDTWEDVPVGVYTVTEAEWSASGITVTAYDHMAKLDKSCETRFVGGTMYSSLTFMCNECGVVLGNTQAQIEALPNGTIPVNQYPDSDIESWRDMLSWISQTLGCFATAGRDGKIYLRQYTNTVVDTIDNYHRHIGAKFSDFQTKYTGISVVNIDAQTSTYYSMPIDDGLTYNLGSNPFLQDNSLIGDGYRENVLNALQSINYTPFKLSMIGSIAYDLGDVLLCTDGHANDDLCCITKFVYTHHKGYSVSGVGKNPATATGKSKTDKNIAGLVNRSNSNEYRFDIVRNGKEVDVGDGESKRVTRASILCKPDAQIKLDCEILVDISLSDGEEKAIGEVTYVLDNTVLERKPIETWMEGKHILNLDYFLSIAEPGLHTFDIFLSMTDGAAHIDEFGVLEVFSGIGIAAEIGFNGRIEIEETIDHGFALYDIVLGGNYDEGVVASVQAPISISLADISNGFELHDIVFDGNVVDEVAFGDSISELTWGEAHDYTWAAAYARFHWGYIQD